jgi:hypothetical protein
MPYADVPSKRVSFKNVLIEWICGTYEELIPTADL